MAAINMHMKFEIEIPKQTWFTLRKPCHLQMDGQMDKVIPVYPPPASLGGGIIKLHVKPWKDMPNYTTDTAHSKYWLIKFNGLSGDRGQLGPYKPCNHWNRPVSQ